MNRRDDLIRDRAYQIWIAEGQPSDRHAEHWARAEREIDQEMGDQEMGSGPEASPPGPLSSEATPLRAPGERL